jgi:hypothetical protein
MKIRVTFDITDKERVAIGLGLGDLRPATREEVLGFIQAAVDEPLNDAVVEVDAIVERIKMSLAKGK